MASSKPASRSQGKRSSSNGSSAKATAGASRSTNGSSAARKSGGGAGRQGQSRGTTKSRTRSNAPRSSTKPSNGGVVDTVRSTVRKAGGPALAIGAGSLFLSHVNDAGFWLVKELFGLRVGQTFMTWSVMETAISVVGFAFVLLLSAFV